MFHQALALDDRFECRTRIDHVMYNIKCGNQLFFRWNPFDISICLNDNLSITVDRLGLSVLKLVQFLSNPTNQLGNAWASFIHLSSSTTYICNYCTSQLLISHVHNGNPFCRSTVIKPRG